MTILIFLLVLASFTFNMNCPRYVCNRLELKKGNICANRTDDGISLSTCIEKDTICALPIGMEDHGYCMDKKEIPSVLPGDYCINDKQCMYESKCVGNVCKGKDKEKKCKIDEECDVEKHCYEGKCQDVGDDCTFHGKCASNKICYATKCVKLFSLENSEKSPFPGLCKSYYTYNGSCAEGPKLLSQNNLVCANQCSYKINDKVIQSPCLCGRTENDSVQYCALGKGDFDLAKVFSFNIISSILI